MAEAIINNVRKTVIREKLTDPRFYEEMSKLLQDLIKQARDDAVAYEQFLKDAEALVQRLAHKHSVAGVPAELHGHPEAIVLYRNLPVFLPGSPLMVREEGPEDREQRAALALKIDQAMRESAPAGWKGDAAREAQVLNALFPIMGRDREATRAIFEVIKQQAGYA